jgi:hypothetical protein
VLSVIVLFIRLLANHFFVYQLSEAGNEKYYYELHARKGLRFAERPQEDARIAPTSSYLAYVGHMHAVCSLRGTKFAIFEKLPIM